MGRPKNHSNILIIKELAERVGFEPTLPFRVNTLSKRAPSATRPSLRRESMEGTTLKEASCFAANAGDCARLFNSMGEVVEPQLERNMQQEVLELRRRRRRRRVFRENLRSQQALIEMLKARQKPTPQPLRHSPRYYFRRAQATAAPSYCRPRDG
jgi:hypothetical protein